MNNLQKLIELQKQVELVAENICDYPVDVQFGVHSHIDRSRLDSVRELAKNAKKEGFRYCASGETRWLKKGGIAIFVDYMMKDPNKQPQK